MMDFNRTGTHYKHDALRYIVLLNNTLQQGIFSPLLIRGQADNMNFGVQGLAGVEPASEPAKHQSKLLCTYVKYSSTSGRTYLD
jgi:hypothetical protein